MRPQETSKASSKTNNKPPSGGFPHSEIRGSTVIRTSPRLIAAYHVLHRLLSPRHPPNALLALDPIRRTTPLLGTPPRTGRLLAKGPCPASATRIALRHGHPRISVKTCARRPSRRPPPGSKPQRRRHRIAACSLFTMSTDPMGGIRSRPKGTKQNDCHDPDRARAAPAARHRAAPTGRCPQGSGGSGKIRTSDLTLIRGAL